MRTDSKLLITVTIGACLWPALAAAQETEMDARTLLDRGLEARPDLGYTSEIEVGAEWVTEDSFKFGEYSGQEEDGPYAIGNLTVRRRAPFDSESAMHWEATGSNLGLDSRSIHLEYGQQGDFEVFFDYDQTPRFQIEDAQTPFRGDGSGHLTLPAPLINSGASSSTIANLDANLRTIDIETERTEFGGGITWHLSKEWTLKGEYAHEFKEGTDTIAGIFAENGGDPLAAILPEPIDYEQDLVDVTLGYVGERLQAELVYNGSWFTNNEDSLRWDNPFSGAWGTIPTEGRMALPPDNQAHRLSLSAGYNLSDTTRFAGLFSYGWMLQDENFLPYTITPALATNALPRQSLDGKIQNILADVSAWTRPMDNLNLRARYRFNQRDNDTPKDVFEVVRSDTQDAGDLRINLPYSTKQHLVNLDAGYRIMPRTKLSVGYDFEQEERTFTEVETTREHTGRVKVRSTPFDTVSATVEYAHSIREGSDNYQGNAPLLAGHVGAAPGDFENHPDLRKFYLADRDGDTISASLSYFPHEQVSLGLSGGYSMFEYGDGVYGLRDHNSGNVTVDVSYSPMRELTAYGFYTYEHQNFVQDGIQFASFTPLASVLGNDPSLRWSMDIRDEVHTTGARLEWHAIENKLDVGLEYTYSKAITSFDPVGGSGTNAASSLPDLESSLHSLGINADYHLRDNMELSFGYWFQALSTEDFALDGVDVATIDQVLNLGQGSPDYTAHVFGISFTYNF